MFVAYAEESLEHREDVLRLCDLLRRHPIDVSVDADAPSHRLNWGEWTTAQIRGADFVLVIASPALRAAADNTLAADAHRGARAEMALLQELFQQDRSAWAARPCRCCCPAAPRRASPISSAAGTPSTTG